MSELVDTMTSEHECYEATTSSNYVQAYIDSACSMHLVTEPTMLTDRRRVRGMVVKRIVKGQTTPITEKGNLGELGSAYVVPGGGKNLISVGQLTADGYEVTFRGDTYQITDSNGDVYAKANKDKKGMYVYDMAIGGMRIKSKIASDGPAEEEAQVGELTEIDPATQEVLTSDDRKRAMELRAFHRTLGHPSDSVLAAAIRAGTYSEKLFTARDVANAERLFDHARRAQRAT